MREKNVKPKSASRMDEVEDEGIIVFLHSFNKNLENSERKSAKSKSASRMDKVEDEGIIVFLHSFNENLENSKTNAAPGSNISPASYKH